MCLFVQKSMEPVGYEWKWSHWKKLSNKENYPLLLSRPRIKRGKQIRLIWSKVVFFSFLWTRKRIYEKSHSTLFLPPQTCEYLSYYLVCLWGISKKGNLKRQILCLSTHCNLNPDYSFNSSVLHTWKREFRWYNFCF